ncbi:glycosyltransferase [Williamsia sp. 1138]|uniref:glycosyltransferase n=1 Tax=Williamsia sp. 1138 TaxID=1903117 RepID=UPI00143DA313|nr:glycosyltransferase [Williamsia sp. 1138]
MKHATHAQHILYLAVIPWYRQECVNVLAGRMGDSLRVFASEYGLDPTVRTGIDSGNYTLVSRRGILADRILFQAIPLEVFRTKGSVVVDLNPRSFSAWAVLLYRRFTGKRILVWGHLHPRRGAGTKTAAVRRAMRRIASGAILYGYDSVTAARSELPNQPVWVAANAIYKRTAMHSTGLNQTRNTMIYVGRLEMSKNVDQLILGYRDSELWRVNVRLGIVGEGSLRKQVQEQAEEFGLSDSVDFYGQVNDEAELAKIYGQAIFSLSPGYVGLSATQSLGFGVPMVYARDAPHAPEVELRRLGFMQEYEPTTADGLAAAMKVAYAKYISIPESTTDRIAVTTASFYSAEIMSDGIISGLLNNAVEYGTDGWPIGKNQE